MTAQATLFDTGLARASDPPTSWQAAHKDRTTLDVLICRIFAGGGTFTDAELERHPAFVGTSWPTSSIRTARSRLTFKPDDERHRDGPLEWSGQTRRGPNGREQNVYRLRPRTESVRVAGGQV